MVTSWVEINENIDIGSSKNLNLHAIISTILTITFNFIRKNFVLYSSLSWQVLFIPGNNFCPDLAKISQLLEKKSTADCTLM